MFISSLFCVFLLLTLFSIRLLPQTTENNFLDKNFTTQVRGIAILMIMIQHIICFVYLYPLFSVHSLAFYEKTIMWFIGLFTFIAVGLFLFLSGYGNWFSINKSNNKTGWLKDKLIRFYVPVFILVCLSYAIAKFYNLQNVFFPHWWSTIKNVLTLSTVMWSFWYLKVQAMSYVLLYFTHKFCSKNTITMLTLLFIGYVLTMYFLGAECRWYVTSLCFPLGCICAKYKESISKYLNIKVLLFSLIAIVIFSLGMYLFNQHLIILITLIACIIMSTLSLFINIKSKILSWLGTYSLELYLVHLTLIPIVRNAVVAQVSGGGVTLLVFCLSICLSPILKFVSDLILKKVTRS